jgi:hypothetical protein
MQETSMNIDTLNKKIKELEENKIESGKRETEL